MKFPSWLRSRIARPAPSPRTRSRWTHLNLERLEDRLAPAVLWDGPQTGTAAWNVASNWVGDVLPGANDDVEIGAASASVTITSSSNVTIKSLTSAASLTISAGTFSLAQASMITGTFTLSGGTLNLSGLLTLAGNSTWSTGTINGGTAGLKNDGTMTLSGAASKTLTGTLNNAGTINHGGTGSLSIAGGTLNNLSGGLYDLQADLGITVGGAFNNSGTFRKSGGTGSITLHPFTNTGGTIDVRSGTLRVNGRLNGIDGQNSPWTGGTFLVSQGAFLDWIGENDFGRYSLSGTYTGSGGGNVRFTTGRLKFNTGGTFDFAPGLFQWTGGSPWTEIDGGTAGLTNLGTITLVGGGDKRVANLLNNAGTIIHTGTAGLSGAPAVLTNLSGGVYDIAADVSVSPSTLINRGTLIKSAGTGTATLGAINFNNEGGTFEVQTGTLALTSRNGSNTGAPISVAAGAVLDLTPIASGGPGLMYTGSYTGSGAGTVKLTNNDLHVGATGATFNFPSGMFQWTGGVIYGGSAGLNNVGFITLTGSATKILSGVLNNAGTIYHSGSGDLAVGTLNNLAGAVYDLQGDANFRWVAFEANVFNNSGTLRKSAGSGTSALLGATLKNAGGIIDVQSGTFVMNGSHTGGTFNVAANAILDWTSGTSGDVTTITGTYTGSGAGTVRLKGATLRAGAGGATFNFPAGLFKWTGGTLDGLTGPLRNEGTITLPSFGSQTLRGALNNAGTIINVGDAAMFVENWSQNVFTNLAGGVFDFQGDFGQLVDENQDFPSCVINNYGIIQKSSGSGRAAIGAGTFNNAGTLKVTVGTLRNQSTTVSQVSGTTLTGGTWQIGPGAILEFTKVPILTTNNATVILEGPGAAFTNLRGLVNNGGDLEVISGARFTSPG